MMNSHAAKASPRCELVRDHEHDLVGGFERADAMDDERIGYLPAAACLGDDVLDRPLGHAGISASCGCSSGSPTSARWESKEAFDSYCNDPKIADLHPHREKGAADYVWHLFDKLEDLRPILK